MVTHLIRVDVYVDNPDTDDIFDTASSVQAALDAAGYTDNAVSDGEIIEASSKPN